MGNDPRISGDFYFMRQKVVILPTVHRRPTKQYVQAYNIAVNFQVCVGWNCRPGYWMRQRKCPWSLCSCHRGSLLHLKMGNEMQTWPIANMTSDQRYVES